MEAPTNPLLLVTMTHMSNCCCAFLDVYFRHINGILKLMTMHY